MNKLTLDQGQKIGHLFNMYKQPWQDYIPNLEEMLDFLRLEGRWIEPPQYGDLWNIRPSGFECNIKANSWTEAAYKAICIIEGIEP